MVQKLSRKTIETLRTTKNTNEAQQELRLPTTHSVVPGDAPIWCHIGAGAFHRAHQALCMQRILRHDPKNPWRIIGISLLKSDQELIARLKAQDNLYTLIETSDDAEATYEIIGVHREFLAAYTDLERFIEIFRSPQCQLMTCTVTEGGYYLNEGKGILRLEHPEIINDLNIKKQPRTLYGFLIRGLRARMEAGAPPMTLLSCDNIMSNGHVLRTGLLAFAKAIDEDPALIRWIENTLSFPNSMVDRITPAYQSAHSMMTEERLGIQDEVPILAESFWQWVIEDHFVAERPPLELGGAEFVSDVRPYEELKLRILNAGHVSLAYRGMLLGFDRYDKVISDPKQRQFYDKYQKLEALPQLSHLSKLDPQKYHEVATKRFINPAIRDTLERIGCDGMAKVPKFVLPTLRANLTTNGSLAYAAEIIVNWASVVREHFAGRLPTYKDGDMQTLRSLIETDGIEKGILFNALLWGEDVVSHQRYKDAIMHSLKNGITRLQKA